jgi:hypothetical protein
MFLSDYIFCWIALLILFYSTNLIGSLLYIKSDNNNKTLDAINKSVIGLLILISSYATIICYGISYLTPILISSILLLIYNLINNNTRLAEIFKDSILEFKELQIPIIILFTSIISTILFVPYNGETIKFNNLDFGYYSYCANNIINTHLESSYWGTMILNPNQRNLYHYFDIWMCGFFQKIFHINGYLNYILIVKSYLTAIIILGIYSALNSSLKFYKIVFSLGFLFISSTLFFVRSISLPWYLQFDFFPSLINYHGGLIAIMLIILAFINYKDNRILFYFFISALTLVHALLPFATIPFLLLLSIYNLIVNMKIDKTLLIVLILNCNYFVYQILITTEQSSGFVFNLIHTMKTFPVSIIRSVFEISFIHIIIFIGFLLFLKRNIHREHNISIILFIVSGILAYSFLLDTFQSDIWQLKLIVVLGLIFSFGYIGLVNFISQQKRIFKYAFILFMLLNIYLSVYNLNYYFGVGPVQGVRTDKLFSIAIDKIDIIKKVINIGDGFAILDSSGDAQALYMPVCIQFTQALESSNVIYRININERDTSNAYRKKIISRYVQSKEQLILPQDSIKAISFIQYRNYKWLYTDKVNHYFMPDFLKQKFPFKNEFGDVVIYTDKKY